MVVKDDVGTSFLYGQAFEIWQTLKIRAMRMISVAMYGYPAVATLTINS
jgi:hypothetical protein